VDTERITNQEEETPWQLINLSSNQYIDNRSVDGSVTIRFEGSYWLGRWHRCREVIIIGGYCRQCNHSIEHLYSESESDTATDTSIYKCKIDKDIKYFLANAEKGEEKERKKRNFEADMEQ